METTSNNIVLVGLMGSGKTTVGRHLAHELNQDFFDKARVREDIKTVIFLGGSQGALAITNFAMEIAPLLKEKNIKIIHQTGDKDFNRVKKYYY